MRDFIRLEDCSPRTATDLPYVVNSSRFTCTTTILPYFLGLSPFIDVATYTLSQVNTIPREVSFTVALVYSLAEHKAGGLI